jgi:hypothetical protein
MQPKRRSRIDAHERAQLGVVHLEKCFRRTSTGKAKGTYSFVRVPAEQIDGHAKISLLTIAEIRLGDAPR